MFLIFFLSFKCINLGEYFKLKFSLQDANMNRYFRAAYSALCGNVNVLKSVCSTWEDLLWAYTKCLVDTNVELQIREILGKIIFTLF